MKCQKEKNMSLCIGKGELILIAPPRLKYSGRHWQIIELP